MKNGFSLFLIAVLLVTLAACAARPGQAGSSAGPEGKLAGLWLGLWHGFIAPFTLVISLFDQDVGVYEAHNSGGWYIFGFVFGLLVFLGGGNRTRAKAWKRKKALLKGREER